MDGGDAGKENSELASGMESLEVSSVSVDQKEPLLVPPYRFSCVNPFLIGINLLFLNFSFLLVTVSWKILLFMI